MKRLFVTTSWDDGYPADMRVGELLSKYGATGTFYVPSRNSEGRPVLAARELAQLAKRFEIGGHDVDHVVLPGLSRVEIERQISENKHDLERIIGQPLRGFCYVRGRFDDQVADIVRRIGFEYARTVENFHATLASDRYRLPTTIQLYPHSTIDYAKTFVNGRFSFSRARYLGAALTSRDLASRIGKIAQRALLEGGYFHLWGHSWELEKLNLWATLETILGQLAATPGVEFVTNAQAVDRFFGPTSEIRKSA